MQGDKLDDSGPNTVTGPNKVLSYSSKFNCSPCGVAAAFRPRARRMPGTKLVWHLKLAGGEVIFRQR